MNPFFRTVKLRQRNRNLWKGFLKHLGRPNYDNYDHNIVEPGKVSPPRLVPAHIVKPSYYKSGIPSEVIDEPEIKNLDQIAQMRKSCKLAASILSQVESFIKVGVSTDEIDDFVHSLIIKSNAYPSPLNYKHFPKSVCTSVNNVACHGIPDDRKLEDGDIINVDITVFYEGYHGDCSKTFLVGQVDEFGKNLVEATEACLNSAIEICRPGCLFSKIAYVIDKKASEYNCNVIPEFCGHGIGHYFHGPPDIYHTRFRANSYPGTMKPGMTFTIEPVLCTGLSLITLLDDGWTAVTKDCSQTAQFEHTVLITETGVEVLTA